MHAKKIRWKMYHRSVSWFRMRFVRQKPHYLFDDLSFNEFQYITIIKAYMEN